MSQISPATGYALDRAQGEAFAFLGTLMTIKATGAETGAAFGLIEQVAPPGFAAPPHVHHAEDEAFYVVEGEVTFVCGDRTWQASAGSFVFLPRGVMHRFTVGGSTPARLLQLNTPAGLEHFFIEMGETATDQTSPPPGPPDLPKLLTLAKKYQIELLGPPHE